MELALERSLTPSSGTPGESEGEKPESRLDISVVFTTVQPTIAALKMAATLANPFSARITLVVPQVVPYPCPLTNPPVLPDFNETRFRAIASESPAEIKVHLYLCREKWDALNLALTKRSLVILGGRKTWWPTPEKRMARWLRRAGHEVIFAEME